jgi:hypothetical protein
MPLLEVSRHDLLVAIPLFQDAVSTYKVLDNAKSRCSVMRLPWRERVVTAQRLVTPAHLWALPNPKGQFT